MTRSGVLVAVLIFVTGRATGRAAELPLHSVTGTVVKANAGLIILRPRLPNGQFGKGVVLKIRDTSRLTTLHVESREGQPVAGQRALKPTALAPNRLVAAIYTIASGEEVLLTAVALPP